MPEAFDFDDVQDQDEVSDTPEAPEYAPADEPVVVDAEAAEEAVIEAAKSDSEGQTEAEQAALVKPQEVVDAEQPLAPEVQHVLVRDPDFYPSHDEIAFSFPGSALEDAADEHGRIVIGSDPVPVSPLSARNADGVAGLTVEAVAK